MLSRSLQRLTTAPTPSPRVSSEQYFDVKSNSDVPTPSPTAPVGKKDDGSKKSVSKEELQKGLRVDLSKIDPRDVEAVAAAEQAVSFLLGARNSGYGAAHKHIYGSKTDLYFINTQTNQTVVADTALLSNNEVGFSLIGYCFTGDAINDRLGRKIYLKHSTVKLDIVWSVIGQNTSAGAQNIGIYGSSFPPVRVLVFRDKMSAAASPTNMETKATSGSFQDPTALFHNVYSSDTVVNYVTAPYNPVTHGYRYEILRDEVINAPANATVMSYGATPQTFASSARSSHTLHIPLHYQVIFEDDSVTSSTTIIKNNTYICFFTDVGGSSSTWNIAPFVDYSFDTEYVDN